MITYLMKHHGFHNNTATDIARALNDRLCCDITISINDTKFPCHLGLTLKIPRKLNLIAIFEARAPELYKYLLERIVNVRTHLKSANLQFRTKSN